MGKTQPHLKHGVFDLTCNRIPIYVYSRLDIGSAVSPSTDLVKDWGAKFEDVVVFLLILTS